MATTVNIASSYAGDAIRAYILKALIGGETLSTQGLKIETGVKYKRTIKKFSSANVVGSGTCAFTPTGTLTIAEGTLEPVKLQIHAQICFEDLYELWDSEDMAAGMNNEEIPASLRDAITAEFVGKMAEYVETLIWQGSTTGGTYTQFDGYQILLANGSPAAVSATAITSTNVVTEMNKVLAAQPAALAKKPVAQKVLFVTPAIGTAYQQNLAAQGMNSSNGLYDMNIAGIEVRVVGGLGSGKMVLGARDNFYFGTDLMADWNDLKMLDQRVVNGDEYINFILKAKGDVAIGWTNEVVYYY